MGAEGRLRQGNTQSAGVNGDLSNEPVVTVLGLDGGTPLGLAVAH